MTYNELCERISTAKEEMLKCEIEANSVTLNSRKYWKLVENCPVGMKPTIFGMAVKADYAMPDNYDFLVQYEPCQPKTNADRIRSMTDEELAVQLANEQIIACLSLIKGLDDKDFLFAYLEETKAMKSEIIKEKLDWLKKEYEQ